MMTSQVVSCLTCELNIIGAKNIINDHIHHHQDCYFFVRCYLSAGNNQRVELNTQEIQIPTKQKHNNNNNNNNDNNLFWNKSFSLECLGSQENINMIKDSGEVVLELRCRRRFPGGLWSSSSRLLATTKVPWRLCFESSNLEIEKWVSVDYKTQNSNNNNNNNNKVDEDVKPIALHIAMKVKGEDIRRKWNYDDCMEGCDHLGSNCYCADFDIFALATTLEAF